MSYTESTNVISIKDALPKSDAEGITQSEYFDFSVTSNLTLKENDPSTIVNYSIELETLNVDTGYTSLSDDQIKIYLENTDTNKVIKNDLISNLEGSTIKTLYKTKHKHEYGTNTITTNYRLRTWIDYNTDASKWNSTNKYEYKFRINVNADIDNVEALQITPEYCFATSGSTITGYGCYEGNDYGYETITDVVIPETINGVTMTAINNTEIAYNSDNINNGITRMYNVAPMAAVPSGPFLNKGLTSVVIPNTIMYIGTSAFYNNNLTSVTIPNSVTTIGVYVFANNNLTSVTLGNSITTIGDSSFRSNNLTSVTIPNSVTKIEYDAFVDNNLEYVLIKEGSNLTETTGIDAGAFFTQGYTKPLTIYNNSGKKFKWYYVTQGRNNSTDETYNFVTGTVPSYSSYASVTITTGTP